MKDHRLSTPSQDSPPQQPGDRPNQRRFVQLASVTQPQGSSHAQLADVVGRGKNTNSSRGAPWVKSSPPQTTRETGLQESAHVYKCNKETPGTSKTECVSRLSGSISKQATGEEDNQMMDVGDLTESQKPKRSKNRRQRRKGAGQQVVGLPCSPSAQPPVLLWFRRDLRLCDNPALIGSLEAGAPVIPVFIWSPEEEEGPGITVAMGGACKLTEESVTAFCGGFNNFTDRQHIYFKGS